MTALHACCISAGRPAAVPVMAAHAAPLPLTWYVPPADAGAYVAAGAAAVVTVEGLSAARNAALDDAQERGAWCAQVSDDLVSLATWTNTGTSPTTLASALAALVGHTAAAGAHLGGASPTPNAYFVHRPFQHAHFIVGDLVVVSPTATPRWDPALRLKEDYDYTLRHLDRYGLVLRWSALLPTFRHRSNPGGAVAYRTPAVEQEAIAALVARWPGALRLNPRRTDEVLLRWPPGRVRRR